MFDLDAGKLLIIGIVALVFIPSKDLPRVLRQLGQFVSKMRRMAGEFQTQFMDAMREADMADLRKEAEKLAEATKLDLGSNPIRDIEAKVNAALDLKPGLSAADAASLGAASEKVTTAAELQMPAPATAAAEGVEAHSIAPPDLATRTLVEGELVEAAGASQIAEAGHGAERLTKLEMATEADREAAIDSVARRA